LGNIDDEQLLAVLYHHRGELAARLTNAPSQALPSTETAPSVTGSSKAPEAAPGR
jgi:hypothetical protein